MKKRAWLNSRLVGVTAVAFWRTLFLYSCVWKQLAADILCWSSISGCWFFLLGGRCIGSSPSDNSVVPMTPSVSLAVRAWSWLQGQLSRNRGTGAGWPVIESWHHRIACVGRDLKDHLVLPSSCSRILLTDVHAVLVALQRQCTASCVACSKILRIKRLFSSVDSALLSLELSVWWDVMFSCLPKILSKSFPFVFLTFDCSFLISFLF